MAGRRPVGAHARPTTCLRIGDITVFTDARMSGSALYDLVIPLKTHLSVLAKDMWEAIDVVTTASRPSILR
jgi:hypothetical protein